MIFVVLEDMKFGLVYLLCKWLRKICTILLSRYSCGDSLYDEV